MTKQGYKTLTLNLEDGIACVTFRRDKDTNAFCRDMTLDLIEVCQAVARDENSARPRFKALVLSGGMGRSFRSPSRILATTISCPTRRTFAHSRQTASCSIPRRCADSGRRREWPTRRWHCIWMSTLP